MARSARVTTDRIGALLMQGNALAAQAQYRDAIRCYEKILELAPSGNCLSLPGEFAEAIKSYDAIIAARPNDLRAHCNRANALKQLGHCHEALVEYERVLKADPGNADLRRPREICAGCRGAVPLDVAAVVRSATPGGLTHRRDCTLGTHRGRRREAGSSSP
jgi:tetratricopeptide (TPR) repeat protein